MMIAADEATGHLFVTENETKKVYEFDEDGKYVGTLDGPKIEFDFASMAIDNWPTSPNKGFLYVPSGIQEAAGHLYAFEPKVEAKPPVVEALSFSGVTEGEAILHAKVNPKGLPTHYALQYTPLSTFEALGFEGALTAGEGDLVSSGQPIAVSAPISGLAPATSYRFRILAENQCLPGGCSAEEQATLTTFGAYAQSGGCANAPLRTGPSALLPDCRAYELATPADTGGLRPYAPAAATVAYRWPTPASSPDGQSLAYTVYGGLIPGVEGGNGAFNGTSYRAKRTASGWRSEAIGPDGSQATKTNPGALSADHEYMATTVFDNGTLPIEEKETDYIRYPDGSFHLAGEGSLASARQERVDYIAPGGSHIILSSDAEAPVSMRLQLEPQAAPDGTTAIYDRTPAGLQVVSLLPGEVRLGAKEDAKYLGSSADGRAVAFKVGKPETSPTYLRLDDARTVFAAPGGAEFAGLSAEGRYLFYLLGGDLYRFDSEGEETTQITETGDVVPVNIPNGGTGAYFISAQALSAGPNPNGAEPQGGGDNLYYWDGATIHFLGTVTDRDIKGELAFAKISDGLGLWMEAMEHKFSTAIDPSRTTAEGAVMLFESRANLTDFDSHGKAEVYRYAANADTLSCLSCDPTGAAPGADSRLLSQLAGQWLTGDLAPLVVYDQVPNLSANGRRAFFETPERLVAADNDNLTDVYEWEAQGEGSCADPRGCLFLISSGKSAAENHIFGAGDSGNDVFIYTTDLLVGEDQDPTPSVYDARVDGGFPPSGVKAGECLGEACQPAATAPNDSTPNSASFQGRGNVTPAKARHCPKGRHKAKKKGRARCLPNEHHKKHHHHKRNRNHAAGRSHR